MRPALGALGIRLCSQAQLEKRGGPSYSVPVPSVPASLHADWKG